MLTFERRENDAAGRDSPESEADAPTLFTAHPLLGGAGEGVVAVASDGGNVGEPCFTRDDRARVDTKEAARARNRSTG